MPKQVESLGDNKYCIRATVGKNAHGNVITKSKRITAKSEKEAWKEQGKWEEFWKDKKMSENIKAMTVRTFIEHMLEGYSKSSVSPATRDYHKRMSKRLLEFFGNKPMKKITTADINSYMTALLDGENKNTGLKLAKSVVKKHQNFVKFIFNLAVKQKTILTNPCDGMDDIKDCSAKKVKIPSKNELKALKQLIQQAQWYNRITFYIILHTGIRKEEALALQWSDIDYDNNKIKIDKARAFAEEEGYYIKQLKGKGDEDVGHSVVLDTTLKNMLLEYKKYRDAMDCNYSKINKNYDLKNLEYVILEPSQGVPPSKDALRTWLTRKCKSAKIKYYSPYKLRHLYLSMVVDQGADMRTSADMAGHADGRMIMRHYAHKVSDQQMRVAKLVCKAIDDI